MCKIRKHEIELAMAINSILNIEDQIILAMMYGKTALPYMEERSENC